MNKQDTTNDPLDFEADTESPNVNRNQFGIAAMFWVTFSVALGIAYLQRLNSPDVVLGGALSLLIGVTIGGILGWLRGELSETLFFSVLIAAFGYICVASDPIYSLPHRLAWASLGAAAGAATVVCFPKRRCLNLASCALAAAIVMGSYWWVADHLEVVRSTDLIFDLVAAPFVGMGIAVFAWLFHWLETKRQTPRYVTATVWLVIIVIAANSVLQR